MRAVPVVMRAALGVLVCAAMVCGGGTLVANAATYGKIVGSISNAYPVRNHRVTARATVHTARGKAVRGALVTFVWKINGHAYKTYAHTDRKGLASSTRSIGGATAWRKVKVSISAYVSRHKVSGSTSFVPLPEVGPGHYATVRIGVPLPLTEGAVGFGQGMLQGARLAISEANASSTVTALGLHFVTAPKDDQGDPAVAVKVAASLMSDPSVLGVAGHLNSGCSIPASAFYHAAGVPMVTGTSTNPRLTELGYSNVFRNMYRDTRQGAAAALAAYGGGYRRAYVVDDGTVYGSDMLADGFSVEFIALGGSVLRRDSTSDIETDFDSVVDALDGFDAASHVASFPPPPDLIYYGGIYNAGALLSRQVGDAGYTLPVMGGDGLYDPQFIAFGGRNGDLSTQAGYPAFSLPDGGAFVRAYTAEYPHGLTDYDAYSYDSARVLIDAVVAEAQSVGAARVGTKEGKAGILEHVAATDLAGATGRIRFSATGDRLDPQFALYKVVGRLWAFQGMSTPGD